MWQSVLTHALILLGLCGLGLGWWSEAAAQAQAQGAKRPNILFAIADDWSAKHAGAYGCDWVKTPAFDRVAREGVLFTNAFTNNPKFSPCRATSTSATGRTRTTIG